MTSISPERTFDQIFARQIYATFEEEPFGPELIPTGDLRQDMEEFRAFYGDKIGKYPDCFGPVRLKEEM